MTSCARESLKTHRVTNKLELCCNFALLGLVMSTILRMCAREDPEEPPGEQRSRTRALETPPGWLTLARYFRCFAN